jgi:chromosome segregation protein
MKIKRLVIHGFKSFAERTVLNFGEGITGVLGPNGCGKSNIVDALRWCMGEQSAKHLRGGAMDDVIFAGSDSRGPMGMAEVTIVFKNDGNNVPPEYKDHAEISITRQLFRDGTSNYQINKMPALLREINELFLGTGIGRNSYAIIEQGRIGLVVTSKPDDRRGLIEDAAGISKYKFRRRQAERKLDATQHNLLRVTDIITELKKRIGSLERQAKKAEKYKSVKSELKELELCGSVHRHLELSSLSILAQTTVHEKRQEIGSQEEDLLNEETRIDEAKDALREREQNLREQESRLHELERILAVGQKNVEHLQRELNGLETRLVEAKAERNSLESQVIEVEAERKELSQMAAELGDAEDGEAQALDLQMQELQELELSIAQMDQALEAQKQILIRCLTQIAQNDKEVENLETSARALRARLDKFDVDVQESTQLAVGSERLDREATTKLEDNRQLKLALEGQSEAQIIQREKYQAEFIQNETQLLGHRQELMDRKSRLNSLEKIQANYEGCADGVRAVMQRRDEEVDQLHGLVADVLKSEQRYETAVEAVLGERLQYVIVNKQSDGVESISYLRQGSQGRSSFIPLDLREDHVSWAPRNSSRPPGSISDRPLPDEIQQVVRDAQAALLKKPETDVVDSTMSTLPHPEAIWDVEQDLWPDLKADGVCGKLIDLVSAKPGFEQVARVLLGDIVIVDDLQSAQDLWQNNGHRKTLVTLDGIVLDPVGVISGGSTDGISTGMLAQKREIEELETVVHSLEAKVVLDETRQQTLKDQISKAEEIIGRLSKDRHEEDLAIVRLEKDLRSHKEAAQGHRQRVEQLQTEKALLEDEHANSSALFEKSTRFSTSLDAERTDVEKIIGEHTDVLSKAKTRAQLLTAKVTDLKVAVAANTERRENSKRSVHRIDALVRELTARIERLGSNIEGSKEEASLVRESIDNAHNEGTDFTSQFEEKKELHTIASNSYKEESTRLREEETSIRSRRYEIDQLKDTLNEATVRLRECEVSLNALHEQITDRYQIDLYDVIQDYHLAPLQSDVTQELRDKLRKKIERMGEINLTAIREYEEVKERYDFLSSQENDLQSAINQLRAAIKKIDVTSKERFLKAFDLVKEKFELVFPRLFNGGRATLIITDMSNPLESGIEMMAQPPGKKLQTVNLLSGGEKALTAISLIFSIFLIKPTPFCLLDEVDAPLDDANVGRYNEMVKDMSQLSQFILITHNKRTMEIPDRLYGVTMEEPGISKLVGVDLKKRSKTIEAQAS